MAESSASGQNSAEASSSSSTPAASAAKASCAQCHKAEEVAESPDGGGEERSSNLKPCITCKSVLYCSRDCKKAHLKQHKKACAKLAQEYAQTADVKMASRSAAPKADTHRGGLQKWQFDT
ncbi:hypothetical protein PG993_011483 [Apiospora rasikravindrae]|uniref:MYND-type domain-containing protein n=1 Tax=Apiospora rasikravindrae TaxID=990691 RepID=A0ABR1SGQ0_9PEZI